MGHDDSWPAMVPSVVPSLRYSLLEKTTRNTQNGRTVLPISNLLADSESGSPNSYSIFNMSVSERFACDGRTTRTITIACPHTVVGHLKTTELTAV